MSFERGDPDVEAADEKPLHSAQRIDQVRGNERHMMDEGPGHFCFSFLSGDERTTASTSYNEASELVKFSIESSRPSRIGHRPRWWDIRLFVKISGGATGKVRVVLGRWNLVSDPPVGVEIEAESSTFTSAVGIAKDVTLEVTAPSLSPWTFGIPDGEPPGDYDTFLMAVHGMVTAGAGTITLMAMAGHERTPTV